MEMGVLISCSVFLAQSRGQLTWMNRTLRINALLPSIECTAYSCKDYHTNYKRRQLRIISRNTPLTNLPMQPSYPSFLIDPIEYLYTKHGSAFCGSGRRWHSPGWQTFDMSTYLARRCQPDLVALFHNVLNHTSKLPDSVGLSKDETV
jgi:hypothetical protein